ncbi:hypothetical protein D3C71_52810 [compost metagenome]
MFLFIFCIVFTSCHFNSTYLNREVDKNEGDKVVLRFYDLLKNRDYNEVYKLFGPQFFEVTDTSQLEKLFNMTVIKLGPIKNMGIDQWKTESITGANTRTEYFYNYKVSRTNFDSKESFILVKENDEIKIVRYNVESKGFATKE